MSSSGKRAATIWSASVTTVPQLARLNMRAPLSGQVTARKRAERLQRRLAEDRARFAMRPTGDTLRKIVR